MQDIFQFDPESEDYNLLTDILRELTGPEKTESGIGGWNESPETLLDAATKIAYHETGGTMDTESRQIYEGRESGAGSGLFQYELGEDQGAHSAIKRLERYFNEYTDLERPDWLDSVNSSNDYNLGALTAEQQYISFFIDKAIKEGTTFKDIDEPNALTEQWLLGHWSGFNPDDPQPYTKSGEPMITTIVKRLNSFNESVGSYKDTLLDQILPKEFKKEEALWNLKDTNRKALNQILNK